MSSEDTKQLSLPFVQGGESEKKEQKLHHPHTSTALANVTILRASATTNRTLRGLNPEVALFSDEMPREALRHRWFAVEDLLIRLVCQFEVSTGRGGGAQLIVCDALLADTDKKKDLINALMDPATFQVQIHGRTWSFVRWVERRNDDVVIQFIDPARLREWIASDDEVSGLDRLMNLLKAMGY